MVEQPKLCNWGFHFCQRLIDTNNYYPVRTGNGKLDPSVIVCKVTALGDVITECDKSVTNIIRIDSILTPEDFENESEGKIRFYKINQHKKSNQLAQFGGMYWYKNGKRKYF